MWSIKKYFVGKNFKEAASNVKKSYYMCVALNFTEYEFLLRVISFKIDLKPVYAKYGFTRENFHNFVKKYYPELTGDLWQISRCWCDVTDETLKAKKHFLEYLAENIDNPFIENIN